VTREQFLFWAAWVALIAVGVAVAAVLIWALARL
jgi:hypothetical protein